MLNKLSERLGMIRFSTWILQTVPSKTIARPKKSLFKRITVARESENTLKKLRARWICLVCIDLAQLYVFLIFHLCRYFSKTASPLLDADERILASAAITGPFVSRQPGNNMGYKSPRGGFAQMRTVKFVQKFRTV